MAVQGFVDVSAAGGPGVTIAPIDSFALRLDLDPITFEALGNDQNYQEVTRDQDGVTDFRFRYSVQGHADGYDQARAVAWSRTVASPLLVLRRPLEDGDLGSAVEVDPKRAIATCLKPADRGGAGTILRIWETAGESGPVTIAVPGFSRAVRTDLLERDQEELPVVDGGVRLHLPAYGFGSIRLLV